MWQSAITTSDLSKHFGKTVALDALTLEVQPAEIFGFLGPNGSGKTTTIRLLLGLIKPTRGEARVLGVPVSDVREVHRRIGYVPGEVSLWPQLTGLETLELLGNVTGNVDPKFRDELVDRLDVDLSMQIRAFSKGNRQKIALISAFMHRPDVLLLDEPTSGLDPLMEQEFRSLAREAAARGQTVFLSSHILDEVQDLCGRVGILKAGRLVEVAELDELRRIGSTIFEVVFDGTPPDLAAVANVSAVEPLPGNPNGLSITVSGSPKELISQLANESVVRLRTVEPSLDDIFLTYY